MASPIISNVELEVYLEVEDDLDEFQITLISNNSFFEKHLLVYPYETRNDNDPVIFGDS